MEGSIADLSIIKSFLLCHISVELAGEIVGLVESFLREKLQEQ